MCLLGLHIRRTSVMIAHLLRRVFCRASDPLRIHWESGWGARHPRLTWPPRCELSLPDDDTGADRLSPRSWPHPWPLRERGPPAQNGHSPRRSGQGGGGKQGRRVVKGGAIHGQTCPLRGGGGEGASHVVNSSSRSFSHGWQAVCVRHPVLAASLPRCSVLRGNAPHSQLGFSGSRAMGMHTSSR